MKIPFRRSHLLLWLPVFLYYALITYLSGIEGSRFGRFPIQLPDKLVHMLEFALLGMLITRACLWECHYHRFSWRVGLSFLLLIPVLALADELHQYFVPGRHMELLDWVADMAGGVLGIFSYWFLYRLRIQKPAFKLAAR